MIHKSTFDLLFVEHCVHMGGMARGMFLLLFNSNSSYSVENNNELNKETTNNS